MTPVSVSIPLTELIDARKQISEALNPTVRFCDDMEVMKKEATNIRNEILISLLDWVSSKDYSLNQG